MDSYLTPGGTQRSHLEIKRSRFITTISNVANKHQAIQLINSLHQEMPDANHHCWAMIAGKPADNNQHHQCDDGEPRGTAGKPMLNVLQHSGIGNIVAVVTRYFGGIKLGSGGLVRAYTQAVTEALKTLDTQLTYTKSEVLIALPYTAFDSFEYWIRKSNIQVTDKTFAESILLTLQVPESEAAQLRAEVARLQGRMIQQQA